jgi:class 3 adenylate cyclase/tetratricopeptide (TPR) repeat protein
VAQSRRTVTILFTDVVDSTPLAERLDAEALRDVLQRWFAIASEVVTAHGGTVEKFIGDAVMAVFGHPRAHEDDALRAVHAALELRERLGLLNDELRSTIGATVTTRTGINTGEVVAGDPDARQSLVTGDAVNVAKRLEQAAGDGQILVGETTAELVRARVSLEPLTALAAKGKSDPLLAWSVGTAGRASHGVPRPFDVPLVGRRAELGQLLDALQQVSDERATELVTVIGAPGIGKSRLARELSATASERARVLLGRCPAYGHAITYRPVSELLAEAGGAEAVAALIDAAPERELVLTRLDAATGTRGDATSSDEIFWAIRRALEVLAADRPLVVILEDLHWAEPTLLDLVEYVVAFADAPVLIVCLARPELLEQRPPWPGLRIDVEPLSDSDARHLLEELGVERDAHDRIADAAEGNPLFLEQLSEMLAEDAPATTGLPPSISALLDERLDRLDTEDQRALTYAAVVGREFPLASLQAFPSLEAESGVATRLLSLTRKGLLRPAERHGGADVFRFRHALIRDAAYNRLPKGERATLHAQYARWYASTAAPAETAIDELVGFHFEQAHRWLSELGRADTPREEIGRLAHERIAAAAGRALAREDMAAAAKLLQRALALPAEPTHQAELRLELIQALWESGDADAAESEIDLLLDEAQALGDERLEAAARVERAAHQQITGLADTDAVRNSARAAAEIFTSAGDSIGLARAWRRISTADSRDGRYRDAATAAEVALRHARSANNALEVSRIVDGLCTALLYGPIPVDQALDECDVLLADARGTPSSEANVLCAMAGLEAMRGDADAARGAYAQAAEIFERLGLLLPRAGQTQIGVAMELLLGDPVAAEREARHGYEILASIQSEEIQAPLLAAALLALGRDDESDALVGTIDPASKRFLVPWQVSCRTIKARLTARRGDATAAVELARDAIGLAEETDDPNLSGDAWMTLADVFGTTGSDEGGREAAAEALLRYRRKGNLVAASRAEALNRVAAGSRQE